MSKLFISSPHSGEQIAKECTWLESLSEPHLMRDADRYVDQLYRPAFESLGLRAILADWHRYVVDLNRLPGDIDSFSVQNATGDLGRFRKKGVHWQETTIGEPLLTEPMSVELHDLLIQKYYIPWFESVAKAHKEIKEKHKDSYQLDCHSMPSIATSSHADAGSMRPEIVVSDFLGKSCSSQYLDIVFSAYKKEFSDVAYNDPYIGGRITEFFGKPSENSHCIQIEIRRNLYMNEDTKKKLDGDFEVLQKKLERVLTLIEAQVSKI